MTYVPNDSGPEIDAETGTETTGHEWDGIKELNTPLPRWWLWTFYATVIWGIIYTILFPAWPMITGATEGTLGYSTRANVAADIEAVDTANAPLETALVDVELAALPMNDELHGYAVQAGAAVFRANCSQCHGAGAAGVQASGYPNLLDDDWLWGGTLEEIAFTVRHGIRNDEDFDARLSEMPPFEDMFAPEELTALVSHVRSLSGLEEAPGEAGETLFLDNCASCHGDSGEGDRGVGAPNLSDAIWLRGSEPEHLASQIETPRHGVMPPWGARLGEADIRAVSAYVHSLGGGETPEVTN